MRIPVLAGVCLSAALVSCAPTSGDAGGDAAAPSARQCFNTREIQNFRQGGFDQIFLRVGRNEVYELNAVGCQDVGFTNRLALEPEAGGLVGSRLCVGDWARVTVPPSTSANSVCRVRVGRKLTAEEVAALPPAHRP